MENKKKNIAMNNTLDMHFDISKTNKIFGLWIYLMSDCIMFAALFAVYATISSNISMHIVSYNFFKLSNVLLETLLLLCSSLFCSLMIQSMKKNSIKMIYTYLIIIFLLGTFFLFIEIQEFLELLDHNMGPNKNAFFSIFFTLIGTHGIHIFFGLLLILSVFLQIYIVGLTAAVRIRLLCFSIFWHFLDVIWICIFTFVYLNGVI